MRMVIGTLTDLLSEHVPLEFGQILHGPHVVTPAGTLLSANRLSIEHFSDRSRDSLVFELDPALSEVRLLG